MLTLTDPDSRFPVSKESTTAITASLTLAFTLVVAAATTGAQAAKLNATPLPHERESKNFANPDSETIILHPSRFQRRLDYRELEAEKKKEDAEAAKKAAEAQMRAGEDRKKAQQQVIENYKKRQEMAVQANNRAVALGKQGRWQEAIQAHEQAIQLDPQNKQFRINLSAARVACGQAKLAGGDLTTAASMFRKALAAAPDNALAGKLLAQTMARQGVDPTSADTRLAAGDQLAAVNDWEGASVEYEAAMQIEPSARTYTKMGDLALRFGQVSTAMNWYTQAIVKNPEYGPAHRQLGLLAISQKDYTAGASSLRKAVILDPHDTAAGQALVEIWRRQVAGNPLLAENHLGLAGALQLTGDFVGAESEYRRLEALDPRNPGLQAGQASLARAMQHDKAEKHKLAAETLYNQGLRREALAEISQAVMLEPRNARYQFLLGECLEANGDYQGAHQAYLTCVLIDPENNKQAAVRMKQMQASVKGGSMAMPQGLARTAMSAAPAQQAAPAYPVQQGVFNAGAAPNFGLPRKDMFEGAPASAAQVPDMTNPLGFRTHDEAEAPSAFTAAGAQQAAPRATSDDGFSAASGQAGVPAASGNASVNDAMSRVTDAEARRDYAGAISLLRQILAGNLQNAEVHHRLAINLLATGQINEAVSEFRIASALSPAKRTYADDLAQALAIHTRALTSDAGPDSSGANAGANK